MPQMRLQYFADCQTQFDLDTELLTKLAALGAPVQLSIDDSSGEGWEVFLDYPDPWDSDNVLTVSFFQVACEFADWFSRQLELHFPGLVVAVKKPAPPANVVPVRVELLQVDW